MAHRVNLSTPNPAVSGQLDNTGGQIRRVSVAETSGAANAAFRLFDGSGVGGQLLDSYTILAAQSARDQYRFGEYPYHNGLYLKVDSGSIQIAFTVWHSDDWEHEGDPVIMLNPEVLAVSFSPSSP